MLLACTSEALLNQEGSSPRFTSIMRHASSHIRTVCQSGLTQGASWRRSQPFLLAKLGACLNATINIGWLVAGYRRERCSLNERPSHCFCKFMRGRASCSYPWSFLAMLVRRGCMMQWTSTRTSRPGTPRRSPPWDGCSTPSTLHKERRQLAQGGASITSQIDRFPHGNATRFRRHCSQPLFGRGVPLHRMHLHSLRVSARRPCHCLSWVSKGWRAGKALFRERPQMVKNRVPLQVALCLRSLNISSSVSFLLEVGVWPSFFACLLSRPPRPSRRQRRPSRQK